ncbi:MAG TPA: DR2241 family protein [Chthoniobacterales bacterium]
MISDLLERLCRQGAWRLGEVVVVPVTSGQVELRHHSDENTAPGSGLRPLERPEELRDLVRYDEAGRYRPLKGAPTLPRGWIFTAGDARALQQALDFVYPGATASWAAQQHGELRVVDLRVTLNRQTGMYRVTQKITNEQADRLVGRFCRSDEGCLRTILWRLDRDRPVTSLPAAKFDPAADQLGRAGRHLPIFCAEACNLLVAEARAVVKQKPA